MAFGKVVQKSQVFKKMILGGTYEYFMNFKKMQSVENHEGEKNTLL